MKQVLGSIVFAMIMLALSSAVLAADADRDGIDDAIDNCPYYYNPQQLDFDEDGIGNVCDSCSDLDGDGYGHPAYPLLGCLPDNCPCFFNPDQADSNLDGIGDACDGWICGDADNDGYTTSMDDVAWLVRFFNGTENASCILPTLDVDGCIGIDVTDIAASTCLIQTLCGPEEPQCPTEVCASYVDSGYVSVDEIEGLWLPDTVLAGDSLTFHIKYTTETSVWAVFNSFRIYGSSGVQWSWVYDSLTLVDPDDHFDTGMNPYGKGLTGDGSDTVVIFGGIVTSSGLSPGFDERVLSITTGPITTESGSGQICIDSCSFPPHGRWMWGRWDYDSPMAPVIPTWSGPHCITVLDCCQIRGDINVSLGTPDIEDLIYLVTYMFQEGPDLPCPATADIDGGGQPEPSITDLIHLVTYMFQEGPPPVPCP